MSKLALVTGGAGFIGTHVCRGLVARGYRVRSLDIAEPATQVAGVEYVRGDVNDHAALAAATKDAQAIFHFAAIVSVPLCQADPVASNRTNLESTRALIEILRPGGSSGLLPRVVFAGSSAVYGMLGREGTRLSEDRLPETTLSNYAAQKLGSEQALRDAHQRFGLPAVCFRFFNVYGPGQPANSPYSGVISLFVRAGREGNPVQLHGGGKQTRDFVSVHDVAAACLRVLELDAGLCDGAAINLGTGKAVSIRELAERIGDANGRPLVTRSTPAREGDVPHSCADISRASRILGWRPQVALGDGLRELLRG